VLNGKISAKKFGCRVENKEQQPELPGSNDGTEVNWNYRPYNDK
jgi:hypothetical protein